MHKKGRKVYAFEGLNTSPISRLFQFNANKKRDSDKHKKIQHNAGFLNTHF
jgi:hypothetical protein